MGHRTADGWIVDVQSNVQVKPDTDYNLLLALNGTTATLVVNNQNYFTHIPLLRTLTRMDLSTG